MKKLVFFCAALLQCAAHSGYTQKNPASEISSFIARTGAQVTVNGATGTPGFIRMAAGTDLPLEGVGVRDNSFAFLKRNPGIFGIRQDKDQFDVKTVARDQFGMEHVILQQYYQGVPVFDGILKFHYDLRSALRAVNGNFIPEIELSTTPLLSEREAGRNALSLVAGQKKLLSEFLEVANCKLFIFQKGLAQGYKGTQYLAYEVEVSNRADIREFVYVDAHSGSVIEQFTGMAGALDRRLYNQTYSETSPNVNLIWKEGDPFPGALNNWQQSSVISAGHTYNLFKTAFGYESFNGANAPMISTHNNPGISCPNANWNGISANYCDKTASDDVVAHEWAHAYTEYTSGLIYAWQAGALSESFSDVWGETVDLLNGYMDENESPLTLRGKGCATTSRWLIGEKATAFSSAVRDMWDPNCKGDPGRVGDAYYRCFDLDGGGVHSNSGVPNHAYALFVDGGVYNGYTIDGVGLTKAAHIWWRAQSHYLSKTSNFKAFADALQAAGSDLVGIPLPALVVTSDVPSPSGEIITLQDLNELRKVIGAVELYQENHCGFPPMFEAVAPLCEGAKKDLALFYEDFENGFAGSGWTVSGHPLNGASLTPWQIKENVYGRPGKVAFAPDGPYGNCAYQNSPAGKVVLESPRINIPAGTTGPFVLAFDHLVALDESWSGGNLKYSLDDGGSWFLLPETAFIANAYNRPIHMGYYNNPLQGERAFSAGNQGDLKSDWGTSVVDLSVLGLAAPGSIKLRWELGTIACRGIEGWYIDNVSVYSCAVTPAVHFAEAGSCVVESEADMMGENCMDFVDRKITVRIDKAPSHPVTVTLVADPSSKAQRGETGDFIILAPETVILDAGHLSRDFTVRIFNDASIEGDETVRFTYLLNANGGNGYAGSERQAYELTIVDDDLPPGNTTTKLLDAHFNTGRQEWVVKNYGPTNHTWTRTQFSANWLDPAGRPLFFVNSDVGNILLNESLESPPFNTVGRKNLKVSFVHYFRVYDIGYNEQGYVEVWDGAEWRILKNYCQSGCAEAGSRGSWTSPEQVTIDIPEAYANPQMKIRFRYEGRYDYYWAVDNIRVSSSHSSRVQTAANANQGDTQYLGPYATVAFYDVSTGNLMAKIKNLSSHDYGCTTVEIDRAGADETTWFGEHKITNKTFKVTPTVNNANGLYEITLYYAGTELVNFNTSQIRSMGKNPDRIENGDINLSSWVEASAATVLDADYAFSAIFNTGFSGFGLSDALPGGSLPVNLVSLNATGTVEGNLISWKTASEYNSDFFQVERSADATHFTTIARVGGSGFSDQVKNYSFLDAVHSAGRMYYRLKAVDLDGTHTYSQIVTVKGTAAGIRFGPNPVQRSISVTLPGSDAQPVQLGVFSLTGQLVLRQDNLRARNGVVEQDLSNLQAGVYKIVVRKAGIQHVFSVVKL
ncbi:hypothetical protein GCM10023091_43390 [Ravibacter arvi]|uniref:T9SS type A sorting domain-containing protein n=1 Tax=Ravibacter arvi TaxID=2051041 RepID=A0ABP8MF27_9BACT